MAPKKEITIYDIAREAGVSTATVSRILSNAAGVKQEKRDRVQALVDKYNFKPSAIARGLSETRSKDELYAEIRDAHAKAHEKLVQRAQRDEIAGARDE